MILLNLLVLTTGISASLIPRQGNSDCAHWCAANGLGGSCTSLAAKGQGPCYDCGPKGPPGTGLCNGVCVNFWFDNQNCGYCGNVCSDSDYDSDTCCFYGQCQDDIC